MIFCVLFHIGFNLFLMVLNSIDSWRSRWRRYRMLRKYAKTRGENNRRLQKAKRHARWRKTTEQIIKGDNPAEEVVSKKKQDYAH